MAARYYESKNNQGSYEGVDERRRQESEDSSLFGKSQTKSFANMPTEVIFKTVSEPFSGMTDGLDDTLKGVDNQIGADIKGMDRHLKPKKV
jgi:hypothetical protein